MNTAVFLDTVGLVALLNRQDQWNAPASAAIRTLTEQRTRLVTTPFVLLETGNAAARFLPFREAIDRLRHELTASGDVLHPGGQEIDQAWEAYVRGDAGEAGIVDHVSFVVMRREGLNRVFSNDRHFSAAGFETLF